MTGRRVIGRAAVLAVLAATAACSQLSALVAQPLEVVVGDQGRLVQAIGLPDPDTRLPRSKRFDAVYTEFFPSTFKVHPGDTVFFRVDSRGEPHALALGTLVDRAARQVRKLGLSPFVAESEAVPALEKIPSLFPIAPRDDEPIQVNGSAAEPCYLQTGTPPNSLSGGAPMCPDRKKPSFDGTQSFFGTGWVRDRDTFRLTLADDIEPGSYYVMDLVHRSTMLARMIVIPKSKGLPSIADVAEDTRVASANAASRLAGAALTAWSSTDPNQAVAGVGLPASGSFIASFSHDTLKVPRGGTVTWSINGMHSITFDRPKGAGDGPLKTEDGHVVANQAAWDPAHSAPPPAAARGYRASGEPVVVDGGSWNGEGDMHSGIIRGHVEAPTSYKLTFTEPGTYRYVCVIHPVMHGRVSVGD